MRLLPASRAGLPLFCGHMHEQQLYFQAADGKPSPFRPIGLPESLAY